MTIHNRYPDANVLRQREHWDEATRRVVLDRVHNVPAFHNFDAHQRAIVEALCARVIPQDHRPHDKRVPIAPEIDRNCGKDAVGGYRLEDMPPNDIAWYWGLEGLDQTAQALFGAQFTELSVDAQDGVLRAIRNGNPPGDVWQRMPANRWLLYIALKQIVSVYYAHPYAWDEIGFGGPAYPRGYFALNHGAPEPWEPREVTTQEQGEQR